MIDISFITGLSFGIEYFDSELVGFGINIDLGFLRCTWYRDAVDEEDEEE